MSARAREIGVIAVAGTWWLFLAIAFLIALAAGLAASFIASEIMPTFHDARALRETTKRPLLGMVSMLPSEAMTRLKRRSAYLFAGGVSGLIASFAAVLAFAILAVRVA